MLWNAFFKKKNEDDLAVENNLMGKGNNKTFLKWLKNSYDFFSKAQ